MERLSKKFLLLFIMVLPHFANAADANTADVYEMNARLEAMISGKIRKSLETRLDPNDFIVSVQLKMVRDERVRGQDKLQQAAEDNQFLPSLKGYLNANTIMNIFEKELSMVGQQKNSELSYLKDLKDYKITGAYASVGLKREFSPEYQAQLKAWLENKMKTDFGKDSQAEVTQVEQRPVEESKHSFFERLERLQWPLVVLLFGLIAFTGLVLYQWFRTRLRNVELEHKINMKKMDMENKRELEESRKKLLSLESDAEKRKREREELEDKKVDLHRRIMSSLRNFPDPMSAISTLITYQDGGKKVAALLDSAYVMQGKGEGIPQLPDIFFKLDIPESQKKEIQNSFTGYQNLSSEDRIPVLESAFWALAKIGVLADYQDKKPFQYLRRLPIQSISGALSSTQPLERLIAVLHLPEEYQRSFVASLNDETKVELIENTFKKERVSQEELVRVNERIFNSYKSVESDFQMVQGALELLRTIRASDEIKIIRRLAHVNPEVYENLRSTCLNLACVEDWHTEALRFLVDGLEVPDLTCLIKTFPDLRKRVLSVISERVGAILEDDLSMKENINESTIDAGLEKIRSKMRDLEKEGLLDVRTVYEIQIKPEAMKIAS